MKRLIVGCGFVGLRAAMRWVADGDEVWALTRSESRAAEFAAAGLRPVLGDVTEPDSLGSLPSVERVLYAVGLDRTAGRTQREVYVTGLWNVLNRLPVTPDLFVYVSSTSVYGQETGKWVDESSETDPSTDSGCVCLDAESVVRSHFALGDTRSHILRLAGIYGPGRLIARQSALQNREPMSGNPEAWLNLIHVEDAVETIRACEAWPESAIWLVCDDRPQTRREFYSQFAMLVGAPPPNFAASENGAARNGLNKRCSNRAIRDRLGVELRFPTTDQGLPHSLGLPAGAGS
jgi:nucleoside-diphosphate-sugar epimerase